MHDQDFYADIIAISTELKDIYDGLRFTNTDTTRISEVIKKAKEKLAAQFRKGSDITVFGKNQQDILAQIKGTLE